MKAEIGLAEMFGPSPRERRDNLNFYKVVNFVPTKLGVAVLVAGGIFATLFSLVMAGLAVSLAAAGACFGLAFWGTNKLALKAKQTLELNEGKWLEDKKANSIASINANIDNMQRRISDSAFPREMRIVFGKIKDAAHLALEKFLEPPESSMRHIIDLAWYLESINCALDNYKMLSEGSLNVSLESKTEVMEKVETQCHKLLEGLSIIVSRMEESKLYEASALLSAINSKLSAEGACRDSAVAVMQKLETGRQDQTRKES